MGTRTHKRFALRLACIAVSGVAVAVGHATPAPRPTIVSMPAGKHVPFFSQRAANPKNLVRAPVSVGAFRLDTAPVTNGQFLRFVTAHPAWRRSQAPRIFAESTYLSHWASDLALGTVASDAPVTQVSWFAADAYCRDQKGTLPTTLQWEYAAYDAGRDRKALEKRILQWYAKPSGSGTQASASASNLSAVGQDNANGYGLYNMVGLVWEWTEDFASAMLGSEPRSSGTKEEAQFCGAGSLGALDPSDYATFMRYSFRTSLRAKFTTTNLGFRCAYEVTP